MSPPLRVLTTWLLLRGLSTCSPVQAQRLAAPWQPDPVLSALAVQQLAFTPGGYAWAATDEGVRRYDGYAAVPLAQLVRPAGTAVPQGRMRLSLAADGLLWLGAAGGLFRFQPASGQLTRLALPTSAGEPVAVTALWYDARTSRLWVGYGRQRLAVVVAPGSATPPRVLACRSLASQVREFAAGSAGTVWAAGEQQLVVLAAQGRVLRQLPRPAEALAPVPGTQPQQLVSPTALFELDPATGRLRERQRWLPSLHQFDLRFAPSLDSRGRPVAWLVAGRRVRLRWPAAGPGLPQVQQTPAGINPADAAGLPTARRLYVLQQDPQGLWWAFSPDWRGCYRELAQSSVRPLPLPVAQPSVRCFTRLPAGQLLFSSYAGTWRQPQADSAAPYRALPLSLLGQPWRHTLHQLLTTRAGRVLAALPGEGFAELDPQTGQLTLFSPAGQTARTLLQDRCGQLWGGADDGLYQLDEARRQARPYPGAAGQRLRGAQVRGLAEDAAGQLWLATSQGAACLAPATGELRRYGPTEAGPQHLPTADITCVAPTADGLVWLGTRDAGLLALDPARGVVRRLTPRQGLPDAPVATLLADRTGALWAGTYAGLVRYMPATGQLTVYGRSDGLPDTEFNQQAAKREADGTLLFGGIGGLVQVRPLLTRDAPAAAPRLLLAGGPGGRGPQPLPPGPGPLALPGVGQALRLHLALADYRDPAASRYFYQLTPQGDTAGDVQPASPELQLYAPAPGPYTLTVWGSTADGRRSTGRRLRVEVGRPWWQHPATLAGAALLLLLAGAGYQRLRGQRALREARLRTRIAADLHDEVGALLTRVSLRAEVLHETAGPGSPAVGALLADSRAALATMRDVVWSIDAGADTVGALLDRLREHLEHTAEAAGLLATLTATHLPDALPLPPQLRQHLYLLAKEAITNAVRHARAATQVQVALDRTGRCLTLTVRDDGQPGSPSGRGGMGLRSMQQRAAAVGGTLTAGFRPDGPGWEVRLVVG